LSVDNVHSIFEPNPSVIRSHLERLFRRVRMEYPEGWCEIIWSDERGKPTQAKWFSVTAMGLDAATECAVAHNKERRNLYVGVNPRRPQTAPFGRAKADDVEISFFQFVDADSAEAAAKVRRAPLPYTWVVLTGKVPNPRPHAYWELDEPVRNMEAWRNQQRAMAAYFGSDAVIDPPRIMRLAGTINFPNEKKRGDGYRIEIVTLRTLYDDEERDPVSSQALFHAYPWIAESAYQRQGFDPETGEFDEKPERPDFDAYRPVDPLVYVRNIEAGRELHNNARDLIAHLISTGHRDWLVRNYLVKLLTPVSDGGTLGQIDEMIRSWRQKTDIPDPPEDYEDFDAPPPPGPEPLILRQVGILRPELRAPRDWLVPYRMMRRHVTMTTAAPGVGKSTLAIEEAISMASGIDFLDFGIKGVSRVAIINNEETSDELERRIEATCQHFGVDPAAIAETLYLYSGVDADKLILVEADRHGNVLPTVHTKELSNLVNELKLDAVVLDPFVQLHYVEENSNDQISRALQQMRSIGAKGYPAAIHVVHHNRKPAAGNSHQAGDMASARGAGSMGGEAHFFFTLTDMGQQDGESMNIAEDDRINYLRLDDAKRKMTLAQGARWFERHGVLMPYGLFGEEIGVLIPRDLNDVEVKVTSHGATEILKMIDDAWQNGTPYSESHVAQDRYIVTAMVRLFSMTKQAAKNLVKDWLRNGMVTTELRDPKRHLKGIRVLKWPG
jgi:Mrp family chromosome partitioning ATPase